MERWIWIGQLLLITILFLYDQNNRIGRTYIEIKDGKLPASFNNYRIFHISDLHNKAFGKNQRKLMEEIRDIQPDIILITGDLIDRRRYREDISLQLIEQVVQLAPTYFVTGNHEWWSGKWLDLRPKLEKHGVKILSDAAEVIERDGGSILLFGIDDPAKYNGGYCRDKGSLEEQLDATIDEKYKDRFSILLVHRPERFDLYSQYGVNLIFSGHAHGGQFRLPGIGGLFVPGQGFLPKYTSGLYQLGNCKMIVSRGLGNSIFPQRLWNRPELVVVTLKVDKEDEL